MEETNFNLSGVDGGQTATTSETARLLGFDSLTHYQFVHFVDIDREYGDILPDVEMVWSRIDQAFDLPYFPQVSIG